ncbi:efflux RND transporter periplasmic adaptor subunit [Catenovulum sp. SM1970]|uniref:efflux RND transporter periplasmic adaptor subunit n=1 Tax=Marinifaba aquimaris TaxID=2741323 RepID=UPI0015749C25|nr:efflux RND transporter periplasmic adaptor subunit [Marinifaba aquimaris]NTS76478.1 efflux RND transporter periplasmic adaptor subunit [Marinifaba aquimaris]
MLSFKNVLIPLFTFTSIMLLSACGDNSQTQNKMPPPAVSVYAIKTEPVGGYREFVARTVAAQEVDLRARVEGELIEQKFEEGSFVEQGQTLLKIDPAAFISSLESAKADLASSKAVAEGAARDLKRGRKIAKDGYISQSDLDKLVTHDSKAKAAVDVALAKLEQAELNLSYTEIKAPMAGRIGKVNFDKGTVVGPTNGTIATLTSLDPIYASFQIEEADYVTHLQKHRRIIDPKQVPIDISLRLPNNTLYPEPGYLTFADTKIEEGMGTIELRAEFANPEKVILPGLYVTVLMESKKKNEMALVPQAAVQENLQGNFVLVVTEDNKVAQRVVKLGRRMNAMWVVESGLQDGERIIIEGLQKVRSGVEVKAIEKHVDPTTGVIKDLVN